MRITNISDRTTPKPIAIGEVTLMPGESSDFPDEVVYVEEFDKTGSKTGRKIILPALVLMAGLNMVSYEETKKAEKKEIVEETVEETVVEETAKPRRTRKKAE